MNKNQEEKILREYVRRILKRKLNEAAIEDTPTKSTGINKLAGVLKIILPQIEASYKNLTTDKAQRDSFRKYLLKAYLDTLAPQDILADVPLTEALSTSYMDEQEVDPADVDKEIEQSKAAAQKIDVNDPTGEKAAAEAEKEKEKQEKSKDKLKVAAEPEASKPFPTIAGLDPTGRDAAIEVYKKTADAIIRSYRTLHNQTDQKMFKDYLITNVLLWIDQYESAISPDIGDVTTPEYEKQKADVARFSSGGGAAAPAAETPAPAAGAEAGTEAPAGGGDVSDIESEIEKSLSEQILRKLKSLNIV